MKGKDHRSISMSWAFLITSPIIITYPAYFVAFLVGVLIGSFLPDDDSNNSPYKGKGDVMEGAGHAVSASSKITYALFKLFKDDPKKEYEKHRGLLHSIPGVFVASLLLAIPFNLIIYLLGYWNSALIIVSIGIFAGAVFHLMEDCCTCAGVHLFYPFSTKKLCGGINTFISDKREKRPQEFAEMFVLLGVGLIVYFNVVQKTPAFAKYNITGELTEFQMVAIAVCLSFLAWVVMYLRSQHPINCNRGDGSKNPKFDNVTSMKPKNESAGAKVMTRNFWTGGVRENHTVDKFSATKSKKESNRGEKMVRKTWAEFGRKNRYSDVSSTKQFKKVEKQPDDIWGFSGNKKSSRDDSLIAHQKKAVENLNNVWGGSGNKKSSRDGLSATQSNKESKPKKPKTGSTVAKEKSKKNDDVSGRKNPPTLDDVWKDLLIEEDNLGREFSRRIWGVGVEKNSHRSDDVSSTKSKKSKRGSSVAKEKSKKNGDVSGRKNPPTLDDVWKDLLIEEDNLGREFSRRVWGVGVEKNSHRSDDVSSTKSKKSKRGSSTDKKWKI